MDDDQREAITEARISGVSCRALAKAHQVSTTDIEAAVDRRLDYQLDERQRLRLVKLSVERIMALMVPFFDKAVKDKDVQAGTLCCKLEERLSLLLGLDHPVQAHVDVYAVEQRQQPSSYQKITETLMALKHGPHWEPSSDGNGAALPDPSAND